MERLTVPGAVESLEAIADFVSQAAIDAGLDEDTTYRVLLAVDEISTNIIAHGYAKGQAVGLLELWAEIKHDTLTITIEDTGQAYNPQQHQQPDHLDLPLEERRVGGLGVYLAMRSVDRFHYERVGDRNRHTLTVNR
jgi:anti-sigma regulatory factor (Ser/Thr protein kinase)